MDEPFAALDEITRQKLNDDVAPMEAVGGHRDFRHPLGVRERLFSNRIVVMKARPGQVYADLPLHNMGERNAEYRTSEIARHHEVSTALHDAIHAGGGRTMSTIQQAGPGSDDEAGIDSAVAIIAPRTLDRNAASYPGGCC